MLDNDRTAVSPVVGRLCDGLVEVGLCDRAAAVRVGVALEEALLNAILHGNLEVSSELRQHGEEPFYRTAEARRRQSPYRDRRVRVRAKLTPDEAAFDIEDEGPGFDVSRVADPTSEESLTRVGGRGLLLIRSFMTEVTFNDRGNRVRLVKRK